MINKLETYLQKNLDGYLDLLHQWVDINSFTANAMGVNKVADLISAAFSDLGFTDERVPSENAEYGDHLVLTKPGTSAQKIGIISHLDTVFPPEEEIANDFHWRIEGDRIYGPGTNDIKGGTLAAFMLLDALKHFAPEDFNAINWVILVNASEEKLTPDFGDLCRKRLEGGLAALVFEAGFYDDNIFQLVTTRKGMATYHIKVDGKSSHAGASHPLGANAIVQLARTVDQIAALTHYEDDLTFNIGVINGGVVTNRVPHFAEAYGEMRTFDLSVYHDAIESLLTLENNNSVSSADGYPCTINIDITSKMDPWPENSGTDQLFTIWEQAGTELGFNVIREARGGLSDGNNTWSTIPTMDGLGPMGKNSHCSERSADGSKEQEYANISSFIPKTILNFNAIRMLIKDQ